MLNIKETDCKFHIDEEKRVVICKIQNTLNFRVESLFRDFVKENFSWKDINILYAIDGKLLDKIQMPRYFIGKAVCADEDEWDVELGKKIAYSRAKDKCYRSFFRRASLLIQTIDRRFEEMMDTFNALGSKLSDNKDRLEANIEKRLKEKE